jgi:hypothetical protein
MMLSGSIDDSGLLWIRGFESNAFLELLPLDLERSSSSHKFASAHHFEGLGVDVGLEPLPRVLHKKLAGVNKQIWHRSGGVPLLRHSTE